MKAAELDKLIKLLETYTSCDSMIDAILKMDNEKKFIGTVALSYTIMQNDKDKEQMRLFLNVVNEDLKVYKVKKEKMQWYKAIYDKVFQITKLEDNSYDVGVDHDVIHNFLVDRLDLA